MKRIFKIIIACLLFLILIFVLFKGLKHESVKDDNKDEIINKAISIVNDDTLDRGYFEWIYENYGENVLENITDNYDTSLWHQETGKSYQVLKDMYNGRVNQENIRVIDKTGEISLGFVGDVSLADNFDIMPKYDARGKGIYGILSTEVVDTMKDMDIMIANNEFTISSRGTPIASKMYTFRAKPSRVSIYDEMGVDLVTLANNHVFDFGIDAFNDTLDTLREHNLPYIGAGRNLEEAMKPYYFIINGYKIAFLNATRAEKNILTPGATDNSAGVFRCYDTTNLKRVISEVKTKSDYVIVLIHYGREGSHELEDVQISSSHEYIDSGADMIIGAHAHYLQGIEFYKDKPIFYNLGDFIFNREDKETGILQVKLSNDGVFSYYFIPARQHDYYTELVHGSEGQRVINHMNSYSVNANINEEGKVNLK